MYQRRIYETYQVSITASDLIQRVSRLMRYQADICFRKWGLEISPEQWGILLKVAETGGRPQGELADPTIRDYANVTRLLDGLEKRGLTRKEPSPKDRRSMLVFLTEKGKQLIDRNLPRVIEEKDKYFEGLNQKDVAQLRDALMLIEKNIQESPDKG